MHGVRVKTRWGGRAGKRVSSVDTSGGRRYSCPTSGRARVALPTGARSGPVSVKVLFSGTLNQAVYVLRDKYLGEAYFPGSVGAEQ